MKVGNDPTEITNLKVRNNRSPYEITFEIIQDFNNCL